MRKSFLTVGTALLGSILISEAKQPNIVFFMVDDMGWQDCSLPMWSDTTLLNRTFSTPNLERLAARGAKFSNAYASAVSSPTRISLMTGMNPAAHRVSNWTLQYNESTDGESKVLNYPKWNVNGLQPIGSGIPHSVEATTLAQLLKQAGYHTIHVGKAHYGSIGTPGANPLTLGFNVNIAGHAAGGLASYLGEQNFGNEITENKQSPFAVPDLEEYWGKDIFVTEALTREAIKQLDSAKKIDKPFFLNMCHYAVHVPIESDNRYYQKYIDNGLSAQLAAYASLVEGMDKSLGDLMDYLERNELIDNTIIIFMSDNGGLSVAGREQHHILGAKVNYPLNGGKGSAYEGGVRVPLVISLPDTTMQNVNIRSVVEVCDMLPTIMSFAGVKKYKTKQHLDGINISSLISKIDVKSRDRALVWHFPCNWGPSGPGIGTYSSILKHNWKLIYYYDTQRVEMYNVARDISEIIDHGTNPSFSVLRSKLLEELTSYLKSKKAQLPSLKNGEFCDYPNGDKYKESNNRSKQ